MRDLQFVIADHLPQRAPPRAKWPGGALLPLNEHHTVIVDNSLTITLKPDSNPNTPTLTAPDGQAELRLGTRDSPAVHALTAPHPGQGLPGIAPLLELTGHRPRRVPHPRPRCPEGLHGLRRGNQGTAGPAMRGTRGLISEAAAPFPVVED